MSSFRSFRLSLQVALCGATVFSLAGLAFAEPAQVDLTRDLAFERNVGQTDARVDFLARGKGFNLFLSDGDAVLYLPGAPASVLRMEVVGASPAGHNGMERRTGTSNYFIGNDPEQWKRGIDRFGKVRYDDTYPGINLDYYGVEGTLEYDFAVDPGADPAIIAFALRGADAVEHAEDGGLLIRLPGGDLKLEVPVAYQGPIGEREPVTCRFVLEQRDADTLVRFDTGAYDVSRRLTIDPILRYSSYLGGAGNSEGWSVESESASVGRPLVYITGSTDAALFPLVEGPTPASPKDIFLVVLDPSLDGPASIIKEIYIGGKGNDVARKVHYEPFTTFQLFLAGETNSPDLAIGPAGDFGTELNQGSGEVARTDGFVMFLRDLDEGPVMSAYLGGKGSDAITDLVVQNGIFVTGWSESLDRWPNKGSLSNGTFAPGAVRDAFAARITFSAPFVGPLVDSPKLEYSTLLGALDASANAIAHFSGAHVFIAGRTAEGLPLVNPLLSEIDLGKGGPGQDGFVARIDTNPSFGSPIQFSTYLGGSGADEILDVHYQGATQTLNVVGRTSSTDLPQASVRTFGGGTDGFLTKLDFSLGSPLQYSIYLGGDGDDTANGIARSSTNFLSVVGTTNSSPASFGLGTGFIDAPIQADLNAGGGSSGAETDAFFVRLNGDQSPSSGEFFHFATYLGGKDFDTGIAVTNTGPAADFIIGHTSSKDFPYVQGPQEELAGVRNTFISGIASGKVVHVDAVNGLPAGSADGDAWATAFANLADALTDATAGDEVWVAAGSYNQQVTVPANVSVYGGFAGGESQRSKRNSLTNPTILNGFNLFQVLNAQQGSRLDGFIVQNGSASLDGAGVTINGSGVRIANCLFRNNSAGGSGGAISISSGSVGVSNCIFINNQAGSGGGGISVSDAVAIVTNCTFVDNSSPGGGDSIRVSGSTATLTVVNSILWGDDGSVTHLDDAGTSTGPTVRNCIIEGGYTGSGTVENVSAGDPAFVDEAGRDLRLSPASPGLDGGTASAAQFANGGVGTDIQGEFRLVTSTGCTFDIGAYEKEPAVPVIVLTGDDPLKWQQGEPYVDPGAVATDGCGGVISNKIVVNDSLVDVDSDGTYNVTFTVTDSLGRAAAQVTRAVVVADTDPPVITLNGNTTETVECGSTFTDPGAAATDSFDGDLSLSIAVTGAVNTTTPGDYTLFYDVSDAAGNAAAEVTRTVRVVDTVAPVITLIGSNPMVRACGAALNEPGATGLDACDGGVTVTTDTSGVNLASTGSYVIRYTAQDAEGNVATQDRTVNVVDTTAPVITLIGSNPMVRACGAALNEPGATGLDACDGIVAVTADTSGVNLSSTGSYIIRYTAQDAEGNVATQDRTVNVVDTTAPVITLNGNASVTIACGQAFADPGASALDTCDGAITVVVDASAVDNSQTGAYTVFYDVSDLAGNTAQKTRSVTVSDTINPVVTLNGAPSVTISCGQSYVDAGATASDGCDGVLAATVLINDVNTGAPGTYQVRYAATDAAGNTGTASRTVQVKDTTPPVITLVGNGTILRECNDPYVERGASSLDLCDGDVAVTVDNSLVDVSTPDSYVVTYTATDTAGNTATINRTVVIQDTTKPVLTLNGTNPVTVECGATYQDAGVAAADACDGPVATTDDASDVDTTTPGSHTVTYAATDSNGNANTETRTVNVVDTTAPTLSLLGGDVMTIVRNTPFSDPGVITTDGCDPNIFDRLEKIGSVDTNTLGSYTLTYDLSDAAGNAAPRLTRTVNVIREADTTPPVITLIGANPLIVECGSVLINPGATATDNFDGDISGRIVASGTVNTSSPGNYVLRYAVSDSSGNAATPLFRNVNVADTTPPLVTLVGDSAVTLNCGATYSESGVVVTDACEGALPASSVAMTGTVNPADPGVYTLRYNAIDSSNNRSANITRTVTVVNTSPPTVTLNGAATITVPCGTPFVDPGATAIDVCDGALESAIPSGNVDTATPGTYTVTYTATDSRGNSSTAVRTVMVVDVAPPLISLLGNASLSISCGSVYADAGASALDACEGDTTARITRTGAVDTDTPATYLLLFNVSDSRGNAAVQVTRVVTVLNDCAEGEGEGIVEGEGEGILEGEGEGTPEGEGEGQTNELSACLNACANGPVSVDNDGDGLTECEEACFGTSDDNTDSDGDGVSDGYEANNYPALNPTNPNDAFEDPDFDALTNIEEFLERSVPTDPNSPRIVRYVAPPSLGQDAVGRGTRQQPFATIAFALSQINPTRNSRYRVILLAGTYDEDVDLKSYVSITGALGQKAVITGTVLGADNSELMDLEIAPTTGNNVLLDMDNAAMKVSGVTFRGTVDRDAIGILVEGDKPIDSLVDGCLFTSLETGMSISGNIPRTRRSVFDDLSGSAIVVTCETTTNFATPLGAIRDPNTGFNTFLQSIEGQIIINDCPETLVMRRNDWDIQGPTEEQFDAILQGPVDPQEFLAKGSGILAASIFATVIDQANQAPVTNARISLTPDLFNPVSENVNGVYAWPAIPAGSYQLRVEADGFVARSVTASVAGADLTSITVPLQRDDAEEGEGEGEGEVPPPGGCQCQEGGKALPPAPGDLMVSMLALITMAATGLLMRRQSATARG